LRELRLVELGASRVVSADAPKPELPESRRIGDRPWLTESELERGTARLHANLSAIVDAAEKRAVDVILMTQASNLRDFAPCYSSFTRKLSDGEKAEYERLLRELETEAAATVIPADAERTVARLRDLDPGVALATWLVARLNERAGRPADAAALYALALDQDGYPNRARGALNVAIRQLAFERKVPLADAQASFALATRNPVPGSDLFLDYCHPTIEGMAQLADCVRPLVLERLYRRGAAVSGRFVDRPMLARAPIEDWLARLKLSREQLVGGVVRAGQGSLLIWLGLPANHEALVLARRAFEQALRTAPENLDAEQGLLVVEIAEGNRAAALDRAGRLAARSAASLQKVDDACKQSPPLREKLDTMGLQFRDGRLVAR
jgi:hypothetical protein